MVTGMTMNESLVRKSFHLPGGGSLPVVLAPFDASSFDGGAFVSEGIACPTSVARGVRKRQAEFFFGRLAARAALRDQGEAAVEIPIGERREPVWPTHLVGSISHIDCLAAAVVGPRARHLGLGLDIEVVATGEAEDALRAIAVDKHELAILADFVGPMTMQELVTLAFSAKESLFKGTFGTADRFFDFSAARVSALETARASISLTLEEDLHPSLPRGRCCRVGYSRLDSATLLTVFEVR